MASERWEICWDFDDTLMPNTHLYHGCDWRCGLIICEALGTRSTRPMDVLALQNKIDSESVKELGFGRERYPTSWVKAYQELCGRIGAAEDPAVSARLYETARQFQYGPFELHPQAMPALRAVQTDGHGLHLITVGDPVVQNRKLDLTGIRPMFDSVTIVERSKEQALADIASRAPGRTVMIGDSKRSDIKPALDLGIHAIWIPSNTWSFADLPDVRPDVTLQSIGELPAALRKLVAAKPH